MDKNIEQFNTNKF